MTKAICIGLALIAVAFIPLSRNRPAWKIGSKQFTESVILGELLTQTAQSQGQSAIHFQGLGGTRLVFNALVSGEIDAYPEYLGTVTQEIFAGRSFDDHAAVVAALKETGISLSAPLGFNNTYALGMLRQRAEELGIATISDLARFPELRWGLTSEFMDRGDGWPALSGRYGLSPANLKGLDHDLAYRQLAAGTLEVIDVYSTDAKIKQLNLRVLEDDRKFFPRYDAVVLYRQELDQALSPSQRWYQQLAGKIDEIHMIAMNHRAEIDGIAEQRVATDFLNQMEGFEGTIAIIQEDLFQRLVKRTVEHLDLVRKSLIPAIFVGIALGIFAYRRPLLGQGLLALVGIVQTIPALAVLVLIMPAVTALGLPALGVGSVTAMTALFLYSLLPIVRATYSGLHGIESSYLESAAALGLSDSYRLWKIELPIASRSIFSGIKTAAVINIGFATLGALIGAGGYGQPILTGIRRADQWTVLEGAIPAALLAVCVQFLFEVSERWFVARGLTLKPNE
jgi:osmoprotectant transport system permease protein